MIMTETTTIPHIDTDITELFEQPEVFQTFGQAIAWVDQYGDAALTPQNAEVIRNLLSASSEERRNRGLQLLERQIRAQAAWIQLFELIVPCGGFEKLKKLVTRLRDEDLDAEGYDAAKQAVLETQAEYAERTRRSKGAIAAIVDIADEEAFVFSARAEMFDWQVQALDAVLEGKGLKIHPNSLEKTAERLSFLSKRHFGELPTGNGGGKSKGGKSASKRKAQQRGREEAAKRAQDPDRHRGYKKAVEFGR